MEHPELAEERQLTHDEVEALRKRNECEQRFYDNKIYEVDGMLQRFGKHLTLVGKVLRKIFAFIINPGRIDGTAVARDAEAPCSFTVSGQRVHLPRGQGAQFFRVLHIIEERQHLAKPVHGFGWNALCAVFRVEPFEALVDNVRRFHSMLAQRRTMRRAKFP